MNLITRLDRKGDVWIVHFADGSSRIVVSSVKEQVRWARVGCETGIYRRKR